MTQDEYDVQTEFFLETQVIMDDDKEGKINVDAAMFAKGFNGMYFEGGKDGVETFCYDDIEISFK